MCDRLLDKLIKHTMNGPDNFRSKSSHILIFACRQEPGILDIFNIISHSFRSILGLMTLALNGEDKKAS